VSNMHLQLKNIALCEPWLPAQYGDVLREQFLSGFIGPGRATDSFAGNVAELAGRAKCVLTTSGTIALSVAAKALALRPGDEILVPAYGVISTVNAFASIGLRPKLVDIDRRTGCMSVDLIEASISVNTRAVCFVNFSGYTGDNLVAAAALCRRRNLPLIEDAACAMGHRHNKCSAGAFGTVGTYSFSVPKIVTTGQGGAVLMDDPAIYERAAAFIDHGDLNWRRTNLNNGIGTNLRFTDLQATLGLCQMRDMAPRLERRRQSFAILQSGLGPYLYRVPGDEAPLHNIVFAREADRLVAALKQLGIGAVRQYRTISQHPAYSELGDRPFPNADYWTDRAVYLPFGIGLTAEDAERIVEAVLGSEVVLDQLAG
jgi:perosamine synthetase